MSIQFVSKTLLLFCVPVFLSFRVQKEKQEYYQVTVYHFKDSKQQAAIDQYLENAWLPALHRSGLSHIGVFYPIDNDTASDKRIFIIVPLKSMQQAEELPAKLLRDNEFQQAGKKYIDAVYTDPAYVRMENILARAFPKAPLHSLPLLNGPKAERIYEFRSYESATEKLHQNKVQMFNDGGEVTLFKRLNFNAVFYADVIAGSRMPNLIYMTSFENRADRDAHWKTFGADPEWKKLSSAPEYQHNVSKSEIILMKTATFSDY